MKRSIIIFFVTITFVALHINVYARSRKAVAQPISFVGAYAGVGYSQMMHNIPSTSVIGGGSGMLGLEYFFRQGKYLNFHLGLEMMYFNSLSTMNDFSLDSKFYYNDPLHDNLAIDYYMSFANYREQHNNFSFGLPIMVGVEFKQLYFAAGAKVKYGLSGNYLASTKLTTMARDPEFIEDLENLPNHNIASNLLRTKRSLNFGVDVIAQAEIGIILDPWLSSSATVFGRIRDRRSRSYRLGVFVDYGVLNLKNNFSHTDMLLSFPGMQLQSDGRYVVPAGAMGSVYNNSILSSNISKESYLNSFVCGVKFLVLFQVTKTPEPSKKKERLRPVIHEVVLHKDYRKELLCSVMDAINDKPLSARVVICDLNNRIDTLFNDYTDKEEGLCKALLDMNKMYGVEISKEGYIAYTDTIKSLNEGLYVKLQPIKKNTVVVLNNLFFDTGKTNIKNTSAQSLEDLYKLLVENPKIKIIITGHTDNVASDAYNLKLSEGRAKAVYDEMVRRGIDPKRMKWQGKGEREPIDTNKTEEGRAANRRVEFKIL